MELRISVYYCFAPSFYHLLCSSELRTQIRTSMGWNVLSCKYRCAREYAFRYVCTTLKIFLRLNVATSRTNPNRIELCLVHSRGCWHAILVLIGVRKDVKIVCVCVCAYACIQVCSHSNALSRVRHLSCSSPHASMLLRHLADIFFTPIFFFVHLFFFSSMFLKGVCS